jgi:hypothetical protein
MRFRISVYCASISRALRGVCASQTIVPGAGGVGVRSCTSSFDNTTSGSCGTSPAPRNPARIFSGVNVFLNATLNAGRKVLRKIRLLHSAIFCTRMKRLCLRARDPTVIDNTTPIDACYSVRTRCHSHHQVSTAVITLTAKVSMCVRFKLSTLPHSLCRATPLASPAHLKQNSTAWLASASPLSFLVFRFWPCSCVRIRPCCPIMTPGVYR